MTSYNTTLEGLVIGRWLLLKVVEFRWEFLNNSVAVCFTDKIPTKKSKKIKIRCNKSKKGAQISLVFVNFSGQSFVRELDGSAVEFFKNFKAIWFF